jgi:thioredoxin-like negative regulator of GroEL
MLVFKNGQIVESIVGLAPKEELKKLLDKHV